MDTKEISDLYGRMVGACRKEGSDAERGAWKEVLGGYSSADLDSACRRWMADTTIEEWTGKPRGSRMPSPAELKVSIVTFERQTGESFVSCGECEEGWIRVFDGQTVGWSDGGSRKKSLVNKKYGAMRRCGCFASWAARRRKV